MALSFQVVPLAGSTHFVAQRFVDNSTGCSSAALGSMSDSDDNDTLCPAGRLNIGSNATVSLARTRLRPSAIQPQGARREGTKEELRQLKCLRRMLMLITIMIMVMLMMITNMIMMTIS